LGCWAQAARQWIASLITIHFRDTEWLGAAEKFAGCEAAVPLLGKVLGENWEFHLPEAKVWRSASLPIGRFLTDGRAQGGGK